MVLERRLGRRSSAVGQFDSIQYTHFAIKGDSMANLSIRSLDERALTALKSRAMREDTSVNTLVLRLIEQGLGLQRSKPARVRHDDLDALAGTWGPEDGVTFEHATAPFGEIDNALWK